MGLAEAAAQAAEGNVPGTSVEQAPPKVVTIYDVLKDPNQLTEIGRALPPGLSHDRFARVATTAIKRTPQLLECEIGSLISAIHRCAQLGLEPNTDLQHAYLLPFKKNKGKRNESTEVQFIMGYRGMLDLALRSQRIASVEAHAVRENDEFEFAYGTGPDAGIQHIPALKDRGEIICFYAIVRYTNGGVFYRVVDLDTIQQHRNRSQTGNRDYGPWHDHFEAMGCKTAIRIVSPYLAMSPEAAYAVANDEQVVAADVEDVALNDLEVVDAEVVESSGQESLDGTEPFE